MQTKQYLAIFAVLSAYSTLGSAKHLQASPKIVDLIRYGADNYDNLSPKGQIEFVDEMADAILTEVRLLIMELGLDPFKLPDVHRGFSFKPIIITYHGELDLTEGWAQDVSEIYRNGNVTVDYTDRVMTFNVPIRFSRILYDYKYSVKLMSLGPRGGVDAKADGVNVRFSLAINFRDLKLSLEKFDIPKIGKISVKFNGNILIDWLINLLTPIVTVIFRGLITNIAEGIVKDNLEQLVEIINGALGGIAGS